MSQWSDGVAAIVLALAMSFGILSVLPNSLWFDVRAVQVLDSPAGESPRMIVDRSVNTPFLGEWVVTVLRVNDSGQIPVCIARGGADYSPDSMLPPDIDLDWWTWPTECNLKLGKYVVRTTWTFRVLGVIEKTVRNLSNIFVVYDKGDSNHAR